MLFSFFSYIEKNYSSYKKDIFGFKTIKKYYFAIKIGLIFINISKTVLLNKLTSKKIPENE